MQAFERDCQIGLSRTVLIQLNKDRIEFRWHGQTEVTMRESLTLVLEFARMNICWQLVFIFCLPLCFDYAVLNRHLQNTDHSAITAKQVKEAKSLFKQHCVKCHGTDGRGQTAEGETMGAQDFTDQEWRNRDEEQRIMNSIIHGHGQMPSFGKKLSQAQIKLLSAYVLTFKH